LEDGLYITENTGRGSMSSGPQVRNMRGVA